MTPDNLDAPMAKTAIDSEVEAMPLGEVEYRLRQATVDLLWMSESDYPFEVVSWAKGVEMTPTALFPDLIGDALPIETISLADFFAPAIEIEDWYETEELAQVERFRKLLETIESSLTQIQVFRIGIIEMTIYIIGKTATGELVGLKTQSIET